MKLQHTNSFITNILESKKLDLNELIQRYNVKNKFMLYDYLISCFVEQNTDEFKKLYSKISWKYKSDFREYADNKDIDKYIYNEFIVKQDNDNLENFVYDDLIEKSFIKIESRLDSCKSDIKKIKTRLSDLFSNNMNKVVWYTRMNIPYYTDFYKKKPILEIQIVIIDGENVKNVFSYVEELLDNENCIDIRMNETQQIIYLYY